jgi:hypothetical protein
MRRTFPTRVLVLLGVAWACAGALLPRQAAAQKPEVPAGPKRADHELRIIRVGNTFQGVRFQVRTGEAWAMEGQKYKKLDETGPVPDGNYDVTLIADDKNWMAFRIDRLTGATWQLRNNKWAKLKEPEGDEK